MSIQELTRTARHEDCLYLACGVEVLLLRTHGLEWGSGDRRGPLWDTQYGMRDWDEGVVPRPV